MSSLRDLLSEVPTVYGKSVSGDFQQFKQRAGLDRHVIPTGFLIAIVLFSTDISSLRDFLAAHDKSRRDDSTKGCGSLRQGYLRDLLYAAGNVSDNVEKKTHVMRNVPDIVEKKTHVMRNVLDIVEKKTHVMRNVLDIVEKKTHVMRNVLDNVEKKTHVMRNILDIVEKKTHVMDNALDIVEKKTGIRQNSPFLTAPSVRHSQLTDFVNYENSVN
ncbi:MAG: hypothetical protein LBQ01_06505 [Prevotellaceae bacterium]|nr:hypothetical protein [Prevotellaceae bacterium]